MLNDAERETLLIKIINGQSRDWAQTLLTRWSARSRLVHTGLYMLMYLSILHGLHLDVQSGWMWHLSEYSHSEEMTGNWCLWSLSTLFSSHNSVHFA